jgi:hypothetical protein
MRLREDLEKRKDMPQLKGEDAGEVLMKLIYGGIEPHFCTVSIRDLKSLQKTQDTDAKKVAGIVKRIRDKKPMAPIVISKDNFILDGHHRVEAFRKEGKMTINTMRVPLFADEALDKVKAALDNKPVVESLSKDLQVVALSQLARLPYSEAKLKTLGYTKQAISEATGKNHLAYNPRTASYTPSVWIESKPMLRKIFEDLFDVKKQKDEEANKPMLDKNGKVFIQDPTDKDKAVEFDPNAGAKGTLKMHSKTDMNVLKQSGTPVDLDTEDEDE